MRHTAGVSERKTWQYFDGLGRLLRTRDRTFASSLHTYVDRVYEICSCTGKTEKISLPYISGDPIYWTETEYDGIGRPTKVIPPDGSPTSNYTEYKYSGVTINNITYPIRAVFDAKGVGKAYVTDAAGQLVEVREDPNYTTLASSTVTDYDQHPGTSYSYKSVLRWDIYTQSYQSKLVYMADHNYSEIYQGVQTRTFQYDSLGRPAEETHPENGTTTYAYNDNGWMLSKTDARGVVTAPLYDALGRPTSIGYSDSTPTATYTYDTGGYGIGRLYETSNANATTTYLYNLRGFVVGIDKTIGTEDFSISYTRNYVGAAKSTMLPNGTTISYTRNRGHKITGVTSDWVDANHPATLATSFVYSGVGALLTSVEYGNGTVSTRSFNTGMQLKTLEYGTLADPDQYLDFEYDYDEGVSNTGQIMKITDHIDTTKTINYTYDDFYRLKTAATQGTHWGLSWTYDRYGNRLAQTKTKGTAPANTLSVSTATNRVNTWTYDGAGNVTDDGDYDYTFDANNMIKDVDGGSTADYDYDVNGQRVMKTIGSETIYYVFGVGQYSSVSGWDKVYVHLGRRKLLEYSNNATYFYGTDERATPRVQTNHAGAVTETWSSYPYGEEWEQSGPATEENRFTGFLRDAESGKEYGGARSYSSPHSRWLSIDPVQGSSSDPMGLNRYAYTANDPTNFIDVDGKFRLPLEHLEGLTEEELKFELPPEGETPEQGIEGGSGITQLHLPIENQELLFFLQNPPGDCGGFVWGQKDWAQAAQRLRFYDVGKWGNQEIQKLAPGLKYKEDQLWTGTVKQYFNRDGREKKALVVTGAGNAYTDIVLLQEDFFQNHGDPRGRGTIFFHEYLHRLYRMGDFDLANAFGLSFDQSYDPGGNASRALSAFIEGGCRKAP